MLGTESDMTNFIVKDSLQNFSPVFITMRANARQHGWRNVQPPSLQHHRNDGQPRGNVMSGILCRTPQPVVRRQRSIG